MKHDTTHDARLGNGYLGQVPTDALLDEMRFEGIRFMRAEVDLVRDELKDEVKGVARGATLIGAGGAVLYVSLFGLAATGIALLSLILPLWAAALIVTGVYAIVGAVMTSTGRNRIKSVRPDKTLNEFKEDAQWLRQMTHEVKARRHASA